MHRLVFLLSNLLNIDNAYLQHANVADISLLTAYMCVAMSVHVQMGLLLVVITQVPRIYGV